MLPQFSQNVIQVLAQHLGVPAREILLNHDLYRDWGLTPLSLIVILLDLERAAAIEIPSHELSRVRTVADLVVKYRAWVLQSDAQHSERPQLRARRSRNAQCERRLRRQLHHLRWLEHRAKAQAEQAWSSGRRNGDAGAARHALSR